MKKNLFKCVTFIFGIFLYAFAFNLFYAPYNMIIGVIDIGNVEKSFLLFLFTGEELPTSDIILHKCIIVKK